MSENTLETAEVPSDALKQWKQIIRGTIIAHRLQGRTGLTPLQEASNNIVSTHEEGQENVRQESDTITQIANLETPLTHFVLNREEKLSREDKLQYLKAVHKTLVHQINSYGIILTLLVSITFVVILQPPGSFNSDGTVRSSDLVACFMFFASLSFLLACTGLLAVVVGSVSLLQPGFFLEYKKLLALVRKNKKDHVIYDNVPYLGELALDNLYRVRRLRMYLGSSLLLCVIAFSCGAFATMESNTLDRYVLVGAIVLGGFAVLAEIYKTLSGPVCFPKWEKAIQVFQSPQGSERQWPQGTISRNLTFISKRSPEDSPHH